MKNNKDPQIIESVLVKGHFPWVVKVDIGFAEIKREDIDRASSFAIDLFKENRDLQRCAEEYAMRVSHVDRAITHTAIHTGRGVYSEYKPIQHKCNTV